MQTKTYFASSVPAALDVARKELGTEAMLLNSKPAPAESRAFGRLEVTFAYEPRRPEEARMEFRPEPRPARAPSRVTEWQPAPEPRPSRAARPEHSEMDDLRSQIEALRMAVGNAGNDTERWTPPPPRPERPAGESTGALARLVRNGLSEELARDLIASAPARGGSLVEEIVSRIPVAPFGEMQPGETRTLAFAGPAGRGKTTSLVKIALKYGISRRVPVRIYQAGGHGVGCQEQMARYAAILGVPFLACESLESLNLSLGGDGWKGLALIDTPGISPSDTTSIQDLGKLFSRRPEIERHLVLRSDTRSADMSYVVSRFSPLGPMRLLFTGVEETLSTGAMVETLITTGLGATFSGTGQQIPEDVEELDVARLARSVCGDRAMVASAT